MASSLNSTASFFANLSQQYFFYNFLPEGKKATFFFSSY
ncbi:hypothetical protein DU19_1008 [Chlamydia muridarum]|nr:hypothetical protein DU17_1009 [Chlamydia muridarum]KDU81947.1 hypothetical protein DU18_1008 [Chlamydia muridarum]KDU82857.1 hypothetical protein DU19_1008 [Chlamydia muridarum]KDU83901.1 hypothetical protein DU20_1007 [Chlamydia muridarum]KDU84591.1 hypothetical protein DU21_1009 [Chlamydia muridarum]